MTYILSSSILLMVCWLIFGQKYFVYALATLPSVVFIFAGNYLYASAMALLMFFFINTKGPESVNKKKNKIKTLALAIATCSFPIAIFFSSKKAPALDKPTDVFASIIIGLLIIFIGASSAIGAGIKRTKGDKETHE